MVARNSEVSVPRPPHRLFINHYCDFEFLAKVGNGLVSIFQLPPEFRSPKGHYLKRQYGVDRFD